MKENEIIKITETGNVLTTNGKLMIGQKYYDVVNIMGELKHNGDYQDFDFYEIQNPVRIMTNKLKGSISFRKGLISSLSLRLDDNEIDKVTSTVKKDIEKIKVIKELTENLIQQIAVSFGEKIQGRKNFITFDNGYIDLGKPTSKWPFILVSFTKMNN